MMRKRLAALLIGTSILGGCTAYDDMMAGSNRPHGQVGYTVAAEPGESLDALAVRFDLPRDAIIQANHLRPPYTLEPHQRLVIPPPATYRVHEGDTVEEIATLVGVDDVALAQANGLTKPYHMHVGQILRVPGGYGDGTLARDAGPAGGDANMAYVPPGAPAVTPHSAISSSALAPPPGMSGGPGSAPPPQQRAPNTPPSPPTQPQRATSTGVGATALAPPPSPSGPTPTYQAPPPQQTPTPPKPVQESAPPPPQKEAMVVPPAPPSGREGPHFIRPVSGETVASFGATSSGQTNDGINIAAPAGTAVHAADSGTVIYTGNELAAFGNLVLIRHAGGWVTAYGHLAKIDVAKGSTVTQGQAIGTVGQTGSAPTPQLHFEIRQGAKPVDPAPFLSGKG
jgi:murein DD-endopeptidase MepM/ murein hydrolase activator NlpD